MRHALGIFLVASWIAGSAGCQRSGSTEEQGSDLPADASTTATVQATGRQPVSGSGGDGLVVAVQTGADGSSTVAVKAGNDAAPVPGATITATPLDAGSVLLTWGPATDDVNIIPTDLTYQIYHSAGNNLSSASAADINGTKFGDARGGLLSDTVTGLALQAGVARYFAVVVADKAGNRSIYQTREVVDGTAPTASTAPTTESFATRVRVRFCAAADNAFPSASLQYRLYYAANGVISNLEEFENTNGTPKDHVTAVSSYAPAASLGVLETSSVSCGGATLHYVDAESLGSASSYFFNVVVKDPLGNRTAYGRVEGTTSSDTTAPTPGGSPAGQLTTSSVSPTVLRLSWQTATDDKTSQMGLSYRAFYGTSALLDSPGAITDANGDPLAGITALGPWTSDVTQMDASALTPAAATHYFNVLVRDLAGNVAAYTKLTKTDTSAPTPGASGALTPSGVGDQSFTVGWTAATDHQNAASLQYLVCKGTSAGQVTSVASCENNGLDGAGVYGTALTSKSVTSLLPSTTYHFNVVVKDVAGNKAVYAAGSQATNPDTTAPTVGGAGTITPSAVGTASVALSWVKGTDNFTAQPSLQYRIKVSTANNLGSAANFNANGTLFQDYTADVGGITVTGLSPGTPYWFNVMARDAAGNTALYTTATATTTTDTTPPTIGASGTLTYSAIGTTALTVEWTKGTDNVDAAGTLRYRVCRSTTNDLTSVAACEGKALAAFATDIDELAATGMAEGTTYYFNVVIADGADNKALYTLGSQATAADSTPPVPGNAGTLSTLGVSQTGATLTWTKATDTTFAATTLQYLVCRATTSNLTSVAACEAAGVDGAGVYAADVDTKGHTGLSNSTTYYFNVVVKDGASTPNKALYTMTSVTTSNDNVKPVPGASGSLTTQSVGATSFTLDWTKATDDLTAQANLQYKVKRSSSANLGTIATFNANGTQVQGYANDIATVSLTGLAPATTYHFNVMVKDASGNEEVYAASSLTTANDTTAPAPGSTGTLTFASVGTTTTTLQWTKASDNGYAAATLEYQACRSTTNDLTSVGACEGKAIGSYLTDAASLAHSSLAPATTYYYNVVVRDPAGNKALYTQTSQATASDSAAPTVGGGGTLTFSSITTTSLNVDWQRASDDSYAQSSLQYVVCRHSASMTQNQCETTYAQGSYATDIASKALTGLSTATTYHFGVVVKDPASNKAFYTVTSQATNTDSTPPVPGASGSLSTSGLSSTSVDLTWTKGTDETTAAAALRYLACRHTTQAEVTSVANCESNGINGNAVYTTDIGNQSIAGLAAGTTYFLNAIVKDGTGNRALYNNTSVTTPSDATAPNAGSGVSMGAVTTTSIALSWGQGNDAVTATANLQYLVYYSTNDQFDALADVEGGTPFGTFQAAITSKTITGLSPGTDYYVNVVIRDEAGNKNIYNSGTATTGADTTPPVVGGSGVISTSSIGTTGLTLTWTKATDTSYASTLLDYLVCQAGSTIASVATCESNAVGTYTNDFGTKPITGLTPGTTYHFNLVARDPSGNKALYTSKSQATNPDTTAPTPGAAGVFSVSAGTVSANLTWTRATDDSYAPGTLQYRACYSTSNNLDDINNCTSAAFGSYVTDAASVTITGLTAATTYYFNVQARDPTGNIAVYTSMSSTTSNDVTAPTPGGGGTIATGTITPVSVVLNWTKGTDNASAPATLAYTAKRSSSANLGSVANFNANGTVVLATTVDVGTATATGLIPATTYHFNVLVRDEALNEAVYTSVQATTATDSVAPTAGGGGAVTASAVTKTSMTVSWSKGSDDWAAESALQYKVKRSTTNNLGSVANFNANGTLVQDWTTNVASVNVTGLTPSTTYYVNVMVRDTGGNETVYATVQQRTISAVHISYHDATQTEIKYATDRSGAWSIDQLDSTSSVGTHSTIALDANKKPHIVYAGGTTGSGRPYYQEKTGASWTARVELSTSTVTWQDMKFDGNGKLHIALYATSNRDLWYATNKTNAWVVSTAYSHADRPGQYAKLVLDASGNPQVLHYDSTTTDLLYSSFNGTSWSSVDPIDGGSTSVGQFADLARTSDGFLHGVYYDATATDLRYITNESGSWAAMPLVTQSSGTAGTHCTMKQDASDNLHVAYYDSVTTNVMYLFKDAATDQWSTPEIVDGAGTSNTFNWIDLDVGSDGKVHISYKDTTSTALDLKYAWGSSGTWNVSYVEQTNNQGSWARIVAE